MQPVIAPNVIAKPSDIWAKVVNVYEAARHSGAISRTDSQEEIQHDPVIGLHVVVRVAEVLKKKPIAPSSPPRDDSQPGSPAPTAWRNPFLPPELALVVAPLPPSHTLVLNKFNVVPHHLLVITQEFRSQSDALTAEDLAATWTVLQAYPSGGLAFFNCGKHSGRSQPHKHLQLVPLPFADGDTSLPAVPPVQPIIDAAWHAAGDPPPLLPFELRSVPFQAWAGKLPDSPSGDELVCLYQQLLARGHEASPGGLEDFSYNVLLTRDFMLLVPRRAECAGPCAINSLGFAGTMLVRSTEEREFVRAMGPCHMLATVGVPWTFVA